MSQCKGLSKSTGERCKIKVKEGVDFCRYHDHKPSINQAVSNITPIERYQKGYIYVYTLSHLLVKSSKKQEWLQVKMLKDKDYRVYNPNDYILIKIGLTQGTVNKRLKQWETQCNHKLTVVNPELHVKQRSIITLFSKLSINNTRQQEQLINYKPEQSGFYTDVNLGIIEKQVHKSLWSQFGKGDVICHGCKSEKKDFSIHKEWFNLKRKHLESVFKTIDHVISSNN